MLVSAVLAETSESAQQLGEPGRGVGDGERRGDTAGTVQDTHGVCLGGPVDADVARRLGEGHDQFSFGRQRRPDEGAGLRAVTDWRSTAHPFDAGLQPRENRGRRCHRGPRQATEQSRHPGPRRVPTAGTLSGPTQGRVDQ